MSRVGECVRVGCNLSFCYLFEKLHTYCVAEAYSLLPGMENYFDEYDLYNRPIELFGIPDQLPIFSLLCTGDVNNYRLLAYEETSKKVLLTLYSLSNVAINTEDGVFFDETTYANSIYHPRYIYDYYNKAIVFIRKAVGLEYDEIKKFWDENITYRFLKPTNSEKIKYLAKMYVI